MAAMLDYDWKLAETHFHRAMAAESVPPPVRYRYAAYYLLPMGRCADAIEQCQLALETDPLAVTTHFIMSWSMRLAKRYPEAIEISRRGRELDAKHPYIYFTLAVAQIQAGLAQEAIASIQRCVGLMPWLPGIVWALAAVYHLAGDREHAQEWARKAAESQSRTYFAAWYYAVTGEADAMFNALEGSYEQRERGLLDVKNDVLFAPYRADPRFQALLTKMNLA
jgi:tetratricopeptide (TPR) repeat protein